MFFFFACCPRAMNSWKRGPGKSLPYGIIITYSYYCCVRCSESEDCTVQTCPLRARATGRRRRRRNEFGRRPLRAAVAAELRTKHDGGGGGGLPLSAIRSPPQQPNRSVQGLLRAARAPPTSDRDGQHHHRPGDRTSAAAVHLVPQWPAVIGAKRDVDRSPREIVVSH